MNKRVNRIKVHHETRYEYETDLSYAIQRIYLTPRQLKGVQVISWEIKSNFDCFSQIDSLGNELHLLVMSKPSKILTIEVTGLVDVYKGRTRVEERLSSRDKKKEMFHYIFKKFTDLTMPNKEIQELALGTFKTKDQVDSLLLIAEAIEERIEYTKGATGVKTTAIEAWEQKAGVCQDHAHVMLSAARVIGLPARYVSGYLQGESNASQATHAWVEVWLGKWIGIDVTNKKLVDEKFLSLAIGADYLSIAPIRGVRQGGGNEHMYVKVSVSE